MNKTKIRRLRRHQKQKEIETQKIEELNKERKEFLLLRRKKRKTETKERSQKFYEDREMRWLQQRNNENLAIPSVFTREGGKCTKKRSPLDLF